MESFNAGMHDELLSVEVVTCLKEARVLAAGWRTDYRPQTLAATSKFVCIVADGELARSRWKARPNPVTVVVGSGTLDLLR